MNSSVNMLLQFFRMFIKREINVVDSLQIQIQNKQAFEESVWKKVNTNTFLLNVPHTFILQKFAKECESLTEVRNQFKLFDELSRSQHFNYSIFFYLTPNIDCRSNPLNDKHVIQHSKAVYFCLESRLQHTNEFTLWKMFNGWEYLKD